MAGGGVKIQNIPEASSFGISDSVLGVVNGEAALIPQSLIGSGATGSSGSSGASGSSGVNGSSGTSGISGVSGINGTSGSSGTVGSSGSAGTSGMSGVNGTDGTSGTSGISGVSGINGTSGSSGISPSLLWIPNLQTTDYTIQPSDAHGIIIMDNVSSLIIYVPLNSTAAIEIGTEIKIARGNGPVEISQEGGVTVKRPNSMTSLQYTNSIATLLKIDTDTWYLYGDLS